ncbi:unnamed protein product [Heligmosomoides polygyrus]|uniref:Rad21_Rec8 domain-containing protein n=1 Tax=Heligmosomoides polygyrus TaxID=6339 RepID=A0A183FQ48_HELPZ|nr:unnamed protein product [Heligmosomoides polygyrus]
MVLQNTMAEPSRYEDELLRTPEDDEMIDENVEQLRHEVENLGQKPREDVIKRTAPLRDAIAIDFESIAPEVLREFAERKLRERSRNATIIGHREILQGCSAISSGTIGHLRFDTVFSLARLISIYDHGRCLERKRLLMMDAKYVFITLSGVRKAFLYFKKCCDHILRGLATHDGSSLALPHDGGTGLPIEELNDANNEGVRFAKSNDWDEMEANEEPSKPLIILPESFSMVDVFFKAQPTVRRQIYHELSEIGGILDRSESQCCVIVGPTTDVPPSKREWCKLASSLAAAARNGMKIIVLAPPRGDKAYERNRIDMNEALELAKSVAVLAKQNLISCIPLIESSTEQSHGPGARPRSSSNENYSKEFHL